MFNGEAAGETAASFFEKDGREKTEEGKRNKRK